MKKHSRIIALMLALMLALGMSPASVYAAYDTHYIAVASDRHNNSDAVYQAMSGMTKDVEYVSLIGDMVGGRNGMAPQFNSSEIRNDILRLNFSNPVMSILWASHDQNVNDDANIVFANGGSSSGVMYTGYNEDGSLAYYIYGIAFYDMKNSDSAAVAAAEFRRWIDTVNDKTIPIIVLCHMPVHYVRKDNEGGVDWNLALNYAATGSDTTEDGSTVARNVVFLYGHNHTVESGRPRSGSFNPPSGMIPSSGNWSGGSGRSGDSSRRPSPSQDIGSSGWMPPSSQEDSSNGSTVRYSGEFYIPCGSRMEIGAAEGVWSTIYYTYTTGGYLNQNKTASLISIDDDSVDIFKYKYEEAHGVSVVSDDVYDSAGMKGAFASRFITSGSNTIARIQAEPDNSNIPGYVPGDVKPEEKPLTDITDAAVYGVESEYTYTGQAICPVPTIEAGGKTLTEGADYILTYSDNINAGQASIKVTGTGDYEGEFTISFTITKAANALKASGRKVNVKRSSLKKGKVKLSRAKVMNISSAKGKLSYKKLKGNKKITIDKSGRLIIKKGLGKGSYTVRIKVTAAGNNNYKKRSKTIRVRIRVK